MTPPRILRVFPRRTKATPVDALAYFGPPDRAAEADEVHVSVAFTYDKEFAEYLAEQWRHVAPVKIGGVAYGDRGDEFVPGRYIRPGYVFTSRGCPRKCWFCRCGSAIRFRGCCRSSTAGISLTTICSPARAITSKRCSPCCGGRTAALNSPAGSKLWRCKTIRLNYSRACGRARRCSSPMIRAMRSRRCNRRRVRLLEAGFTAASHLMRVYVLIGFPKDTILAAEQRLQQMLSLGFTPHAMLWRPETPSQMKWAPEESWRRFQRLWARPAIIHAREAVPYRRSPADRARVKAARAAQRDDARDRANLRPTGRPAKAETVYNDESDVHAFDRPSGNSRAAFLRRLRKDRPDIHARILAGEITPHGGMVEAGFRKKPI